MDKFPISNSPFLDSATDNIARNGMKTAVRMKPVIAGIKKSPDSIPKYGGKIKFPAPKNNENNIKPKTIIFLFFKIVSSQI